MRAPRTGWSENWRRRMPNSWQLSAKAERKPTTPRVGTSSCYVNLASQNYIKNISVTNWISSNKIFDKDIFSWYCICLSIGVGLKTFFFKLDVAQYRNYMYYLECFQLYLCRIAETSERKWEKNGRYGQNMGAKTGRSKVDF